MTDLEILTKLNALFQDVFDDASLDTNKMTNTSDIPGWDSMAQVTLAIEIEQIFKIRIMSAEMEKLRNVGDITDLIQSRMAPVA